MCASPYSLSTDTPATPLQTRKQGNTLRNIRTAYGDTYVSERPHRAVTLLTDWPDLLERKVNLHFFEATGSLL